MLGLCGRGLLGRQTSRLHLVSNSVRAAVATPKATPRVPPARWYSEHAATKIDDLPKILLRDYQEECIQSVLKSLDNGHKRLGISLATGSGKTVIFTQLIDRVEPVSPEATQTLILAHRRELVEQAARHCIRAYPDKTVEIEMGSMHATGAADITIASVQSITSGDRIFKFNPSRFKLVLVDEAHHIVAPGYLRTLEHFGLESKREESPHLVGVSATFSRFDGLRLGAAIDEIVYHKDYVDMIRDSWLSDVVFTTVESSADLSDVKSQGDFNATQLSRAVNTPAVNEITVRSWLAKAGGRKSTLVFCVDLAHVADLTQKFRDYGVDARFVTGDTHRVERSDCLEAFRRGEFPVLVNCGVFTEGTDIPNIDCVILARPTKSRNLLVQMIGRGMRLHPGKDDCHVIDMVSSLETGIVTTPTLFGLDPSELVDNASADELRALKDRRAAGDERQESTYQKSGKGGGGNFNPTSVTFTEYKSVMDLISDTSDEQHIRAISQYAWVGVGSEKYILAGPTGTFLRLEPTAQENKDQPLFRVYEIRALPPGISKSPYAAPREIAKALTFIDAVHAADKYASEVFPHTFVARRQGWRNGPPTPGQLKFLNKLRGKAEPLTEDDVTKGEAMDRITKLKHGARGRFASYEADRRRQQRQSLVLERDQARRAGENITVGPVVV